MKSETISTVTIKSIAQAAGVSTGTVDRALHGRYGVKRETRERIEKLAIELGYSPNRSARSLALRKEFRVRIVVLANIWPFVEKGIRAFLSDNDHMQVEVLCDIVSCPDTEVVPILHRTLASQDVDGILLCAAHSLEIVDYCNQLMEVGIPVVTFNSDLQAKRLGFVGQNLVEAGRLAASLLANFIGRQGSVYVINGFASMKGHQQRLSGFLSEMATNFPQIKVLGIAENHDSSDISKTIVDDTIARYPEMKGIFVVAAGAGGAGEKLKELGLAGKVKMVCFDFVPETIEQLKCDSIQAIIGQDFFKQGYHSLRILIDYLSLGRSPESDSFFTSMDIGLSCNIDFLLERQSV